MLRGTVTALTRSTDTSGVFVVGGVLTLLTWVLTPAWIAGTLFFPPLVLLAPLALAPAFVARGYFVRVLAAAIESGNADGAPPVVAWNVLYRDGIKSALVSAVLLAPLALGLGLAALAAGILGSGAVDPAPAVTAVRGALGEGGVAAVGGVAGGLVGTVAMAYLLAFAYVRPAALAAFAASGRLRDGFRPGRVAGVAGSGSYATAWVVAAATLGAGYALAGPFVPLVVGLGLVFVVRVVAYGLYGRGAGATLSVADPGAEGEASETSESTRTEAADRSLDRGRHSTPEVPPPVQIGRSVSIGERQAGRAGVDGSVPDGAVSGGTVPDGSGGALGADGGFDWYAAGGESNERARDGAADDGDRARGAAADDTSATDEAPGGDNAPATDEAFEWSVEVAEPEDKS
ncbi:DUF4013 domain-containing protein [Halorubrum sp. FL23]|uniref:DUF4013 domain-containing protein n=1 Tax=Halorubrum sp. FL23 TaxID=3458704 RepID=UPI0040340731